METKHEIPLVQSEGWTRGLRLRWRCRLKGHSVGAQVGLSHAHPVDHMKADLENVGLSIRLCGPMDKASDYK